MKKILLSVISVVFLLVSNHTFAQITFGPKLALNLSSRLDKNVSSRQYDYKSKIGFQVGGIVNFQLNNYFSIRPELVYSNVSVHGYIPTYYYEVSGFGTWSNTTHDKYNVSYLSIPLNFVGQIPVTEKFKLQAIAGPYASLCLGGKMTNEVTLHYYGTSETTIKTKKISTNENPNQPNINKFDWGVNLGLGFQFNSIVFSAIYSIGLSDIKSVYTSNPNSTFNKTYNRNLSFSIAYLFGGKGNKN